MEAQSQSSASVSDSAPSLAPVRAPAPAPVPARDSGHKTVSAPPVEPPRDSIHAATEKSGMFLTSGTSTFAPQQQLFGSTEINKPVAPPAFTFPSSTIFSAAPSTDSIGTASTTPSLFSIKPPATATATATATPAFSFAPAAPQTAPFSIPAFSKSAAHVANNDDGDGDDGGADGNV